MKYVFIFIGGGLGSVCRFFISSVLNQYINIVFPIGTFSVNLIGSFIIGLLFFLFQNITIPVELRLFLIIGFLGGFTTFSSYSLETINLLRDGETRFLLFNIVFTNFFCLLSTVFGIFTANLLMKLFR